MTKPAAPLPDAGGSFIRNPDGSLAPRAVDPAPIIPVVEALTEKPAAKGVKQPVKEA